MSWDVQSQRKCTKCGHNFNQSEDTISTQEKTYGKCPVCGADSIAIDKMSKSDLFKKLGIKK